MIIGRKEKILIGKVVSIDKSKEEPKEFCLLCGKYVNDPLEAVPTINFDQQTLMMKMCKSCGVVIHNFLKAVDQAIKDTVKQQQERRIILS